MERLLIIDAWEDNVDKHGPIIGPRLGRCWIWLRAIDPRTGYGMVWVPEVGRTENAHRAVWRRVNGDPGGLFVLHRCDNRPCVRPSHMYLGTRQNNSDDATSRGRQSRGEDRPMAKLTEAAVIDLRRRCANGESQRALAKAFGVNQSQVSRAAHGKRWRHVSG